MVNRSIVPSLHRSIIQSRAASLQRARAAMGELSGWYSRATCAHSRRAPSRVRASGEGKGGNGARERANANRESRRAALVSLTSCACALCARKDARADVALRAPAKEASERYDVKRDANVDARFSRAMATTMRGFERAVVERKTTLFQRALSAYDGTREISICDVGAGTMPNAEFYAEASRGRAIDLICVDPNDSMRSYAEENLQKARSRVSSGEVNARFVHGVSEALPLPDSSVDCVVSTLVLCSVIDQGAALREIHRVLKPGGKFLFLEHVLSETDPKLAELQKKLTPLQVAVADGCRLDRRTLQAIRNEFAVVDGEYYELDGFWVISPQVSGIAIA